MDFIVIQLSPYCVIPKSQQLNILVRGIVTLNNKSALSGKWVEPINVQAVLVTPVSFAPLLARY